MTRKIEQRTYGADVRHHMRLKRPCLKKMNGRAPIKAKLSRYRKSVASFILLDLHERARPLQLRLFRLLKPRQDQSSLDFASRRFREFFEPQDNFRRAFVRSEILCETLDLVLNLFFDRR